MSYVEQNKAFWDKHFANTSLDYPNEEVVRFLARCKHVYPNGKMLDWGCATGRHTILGCKFGFQVIAADYVERCVEITKAKVTSEGKNLSGKVVDYIVNQNIDIEKISGEALDIILAWGITFYNTEEQQLEMVRNMYRMLKPGGRVFLDFRTQRDSIYLNRVKRAGTDGYIKEDDSASLEGLYMEFFSLEDLKEMLVESGFIVENVELYEFTQENQKVHNSWWHVTLLKP